MKNHKPLFSIVLPTRDRPQLVAIVLRYLQCQQFKDFEVIVSDNAVQADCWQQVASFIQDPRFRYIKPPHPMNMCHHWEFAVAEATGRYVTVFCEKFILRPDALRLLAAEIDKSSPDILTWQFEMFDTSETDNYSGSYHPLIKPGTPINYAPEAELQRRFQFDYPLFCRLNKPRDSYGKIYSGFVKKHLLDDIKLRYGQIFPPSSPDFTSMIMLLNHSQRCVDINQPLMLLLNIRGASNGETTKHSLPAVKRFFASYGLDFYDYSQLLPIAGFGIGHNNTIAAEFLRLQQLMQSGPIKSVNMDIHALSFWASIDLNEITEWGGESKEYYAELLTPWLESLSPQRKATLLVHQQHKLMPASNEIYHSGLQKIEDFTAELSATNLANCHWHEGKAPPRKPVTEAPMSLRQAVDYFTEYQQVSCRLLGIK